MLLNTLATTLPPIFCGALFLCAVLCDIGAIKHALNIGKAEKPDSFKRAWRLWAIGLIVLAVCAYTTQWNCVNELINVHLANETKLKVAQICTISYLAPLLVIVLRICAAILRRLTR